MKRIYTFIVAVLITASVFAQTPQKMTYQAVVRDANNNLVTNTQVGIEINILEGSATGTQVYTETQTPTTNDNGLLTIEFGGQTGFDAIDWSNGLYFLETKIDPDNSGTYTIIGVSQLLTVPYALHAKTAESISGTINEDDPIYTNSQASNITSTDITNLSNLSGVNTGDQDISGIATNEQAIQDTASQIRADIPDVSGFITTEADPIFTASPANGITNTDITNWNNKLDTEVDGSVTNEVNTNLELNGTTLEITDANGTLTADLSSLQSGSGELGTFSISYLRQKHTILVGDNYFDPQVLTVNKGDTIEFIWVEGYHTTTTDVTTGLDHWDVPITSTNTSYTEVIDGSDTIAYYCQAQGGAGGVGMSGTIIIRNPNDNIDGNNIQTANMDNDPENELQNLSISNDTLSITNGNNIILPNKNTFKVLETDGVFVVPNGINKIIVEMWGAGGGGASSNGSTGGPSGGGGGYGKVFIDVTPGQNISYSIGLGGVGSTTYTSNDATDGGSTNFDIYYASGGTRGYYDGTNKISGTGGTSNAIFVENGKNGVNKIGGNAGGLGTTIGKGGNGPWTTGSGENGHNGLIIVYW